MPALNSSRKPLRPRKTAHGQGLTRQIEQGSEAKMRPMPCHVSTGPAAMRLIGMRLPVFTLVALRGKACAACCGHGNICSLPLWAVGLAMAVPVPAIGSAFGHKGHAFAPQAQAQIFRQFF